MHLWFAVALCLLVAGCQKPAPEPRDPGDAPDPGEDEQTESGSQDLPAQSKDAPEIPFGRQQAVINEDYRFRLDPPGPTWVMLDESEAQALVAEALAGAMDLEQQVAGVVFVERVGATDIDTFHAHLVERSSGSEVFVESLEKVVHGGRPAIRVVTLEAIEGLPIVRLELIAIHQGLAYHVNVWGRADFLGDDREPLERFAAAFSITEGLVRPRELARAVTDADGVGWRLRDGIYEDAVYGIRIEPRGGWHVAVGTDLKWMSTEARVGLVSESAYVVLIAEKVFYDRKIFSAWAFRHTEQGMGISRSGAPIGAEIGGKRISLLRYRTETMEYLYGIGFHGDTAFQVLAWYLPGVKEQAEAALPDAWSAVSLLEPAAWKRLESELDRDPDRQVLVGEGFALRGGVYRDFTNGFDWTKPRGRWRVATGEDARAINPDADVVIEDLEHGVYGVLIAESGDWDQRGYHAAVVGTMDLTAEDEILEDAVRARLGSLPGLASTIRVREGDLSYTYRVVTALRGRRAFQICFYGASASMKRARKSIGRALRAIGFPEDPPLAVERAGARVRHHQLGFEFEPPAPGWRVEEVPLAEALGVTGAVYFFTGGTGLVFVAAFVDPTSGSEDEVYLDLFEVIAAQLSQTVPGGEAVRGERVEFAGATWDHMRLGEIGDYYMTSRGSVIYLLAVAVEPAGPGDPPAEQMRNGFKFLE